jgi:hypothetical protein
MIIFEVVECQNYFFNLKNDKIEIDLTFFYEIKGCAICYR